MFCGVYAANKTQWSLQSYGRNEESLNCVGRSLFSGSENRALLCQWRSWLVDFSATERFPTGKIKFCTVWRRQRIYVCPSCVCSHFHFVWVCPWDWLGYDPTGRSLCTLEPVKRFQYFLFRIIWCAFVLVCGNSFCPYFLIVFLSRCCLSRRLSILAPS